LENLFLSWYEFKKGKSNRKDLAIFEADLEENLFQLHEDLRKEKYVHGSYQAFVVHDPKERNIHKASVRDRIVHRAVFRVLYPLLDRGFIHDSYSSRDNKSTHKANKRFRSFALAASRNNTRPIYILKCDVKKFFDSVDHEILIRLLRRKISDVRAVALLRGILSSFYVLPGKGIPLGNLTSQLFSNIYLNHLDQYVKRRLQVKQYIRYADDLVIVSPDRSGFGCLIRHLGDFLRTELFLDLHPRKLFIRKWHQGVDFLGYVSHPGYSILRTSTRRRITRKMQEVMENLRDGNIDLKSFMQSVQSYRGVLKHCKSHKLTRRLDKIIFPKRR
jgi:hypothetical protein